jgi:hypothetical protein
MFLLAEAFLIFWGNKGEEYMFLLAEAFWLFWVRKGKEGLKRIEDMAVLENTF